MYNNLTPYILSKDTICSTKNMLLNWARISSEREILKTLNLEILRFLNTTDAEKDANG